MDLGLKGRSVLVTGGGRGLGKAICTAFAAEGADVAINYRETKKGNNSSAIKAQELANNLASTYQVRATPVCADIGETAQAARLFHQAVTALGQIDILVNNAGIWPKAYVHEMSPDEWDEVIAVNLTGAFLLCKEAVSHWLKYGIKGRILNIVSQAAFHGATSGHAHYAAAKAGLVAFSISLAREVAPKGIRVNCLAPGIIDTDMIRSSYDHDPERYLQRIPLGRIAEAREVADAALFLCSNQASYITGATLDVTGGMLMR